MCSGSSSASGFLISAVTSDTSQTVDAGSLLEALSSVETYRVCPVPLDELPGWQLEDRLVHATGRFFSVEGISVRTNFGPLREWQQPIIVQPEIGILGILVKKIGGIYHFLMQVKMEPGNSEPVQFAATVQATPSNYERVHGGKSTPYLDYFRQHSDRKVLVDQLLSEHSSWYLHKRNRNMIIEVPPGEEVVVQEGYAWLTLKQIRRELVRGARVNMNARTVLSCISYAAATAGSDCASDFESAVVESHRARRSERELALAITWLIDQKARYRLDVRRVGLAAMAEWVCDGSGIRHRDELYFQIIGVTVATTSREVTAWSQPMLQPRKRNVVVFLCQRRAGVLEFLAQAIVQPGAIDVLELAATIQFAPASCRGPSEYPPLLEYLESPKEWIRLDASQSEDGGRFYHADTRNMVIEIPETHLVEAPENYRWVSLGLLNRLMSCGYYVNVEARSLVACLL